MSKWPTAETTAYAAHPVFEHKGLGRHAGRIFEALAGAGEATAKRLVVLSGCARPTVYRLLKLMLQLQLVGYDPSRRTWWACTEQLDGAARKLGTQHIPAARAARIERERSAYRKRLRESRSRALARPISP